jgi:hypothetical protein
VADSQFGYITKLKKEGHKLIFICVLVPFTHVLFDCNNVSFISTWFGSCLVRSNVQSRNEYELKRYFLRKVEKGVKVKQQTNVQLPNKCDLKKYFLTKVE